jgi:acetylornithine/succinyldiaminopimelate/putrescine aminotransferase
LETVCKKGCENKPEVKDILILEKQFQVVFILFQQHSSITDVIKQGQHGSTFGGNPIAATV